MPYLNHLNQTLGLRLGVFNGFRLFNGFSVKFKHLNNYGQKKKPLKKVPYKINLITQFNLPVYCLVDDCFNVSQLCSPPFQII